MITTDRRLVGGGGDLRSAAHLLCARWKVLEGEERLPLCNLLINLIDDFNHDVQSAITYLDNNEGMQAGKLTNTRLESVGMNWNLARPGWIPGWIQQYKTDSSVEYGTTHAHGHERG